MAENNHFATDDLTYLSLCTGIGGIDEAAEWAGFNVVGQVEIADRPFRGTLPAMAPRAKMEGSA